MPSQRHTIPGVFFQAAEKHATLVALHDRHRKPETKLTYAELAQEVRAFGAGLAKTGLEYGDRIALFSDNRPRWMIADLAILGIGAVDVPRGSDTSDSEFEFILTHSGAVMAILQDMKLYNRLAQKDALKALRGVIILDDGFQGAGPSLSPPVANFSDILMEGHQHRGVFEEQVAKVQPETLATIVYTSGTTGSPKGVMLTHANLAHQPVGVNLGTPATPGEIQLSILPTWHAYERATEYYGLYHGHAITYSDKRYLKKDMEELRPHLMPCVPRIWESIYDAIQDKVSKAPPARQKLFRFFEKVGRNYIAAKRTATGTALVREPVSAAARAIASAKMLALAPLYKTGDALVFSKLRTVTGGRMRAAVSGGGSLASYLDDFFEVVGIPILNGYGLTETAPVLTNRRVNHNVRGSVGLPMPETEIQIRGENGEVLPQGQVGVIFARGPQVMSGYYNNPDATAKVLDAERWFNTGDLGYIATTGDLAIAGRAKDTIVLASGENVEPEPIEDAARKSPLVTQIVLVGQDQKTVGALVVPSYDALAAQIGLSPGTPAEQLASDAKAIRAVRDSVNKAMTDAGTFKASEQVSQVALLTEPFSEENGMLTQTLKIKRNVVLKHYENVISGLYR